MPSQLSTIGNRYYFTGREYDEETGLYYLRNRYYSPTIGRFVSRNPLSWSPDDVRILKSTIINVPSSLRKIPDFATVFPILVLLTRQTNPFVNLNSLYTSSPEVSLNRGLATIITNTGKTNSRLLHLYLYCLNSPTNFVDPLGLQHQFTESEITWFAIEFALGLGIGAGAVAAGITGAPLWITAGLVLLSAGIIIHSGWQAYQWGSENIEAYLERFDSINNPDKQCP